MFTHKMHSLRIHLRDLLAVIVLFGAAFMVFAQKPAATPSAVQYWMDVATVTVSGIANTASSQDAISTDALGLLTGNTTGQFGGTKGMQPGRWLDVALAIPTDSAKSVGGSLSVLQSIPKGQNMGQSLQLSRLPTPPSASSSPSSNVSSNASLSAKQNTIILRGPDADSKTIENSKIIKDSDSIDSNAQKKLLLYWGCGDRVRVGQPRHLDMSTANNSSPSPSAGLKGRAVVEPGPSPDSGVAIWPNNASRTLVPKEASLVGKHAFSGDNIPANMQFELKAKQDFMPALAINVNGIKGSATMLNWSRIATAQGYFLMATAKNNRETIIWTSSELPEPGWGLMDYASNANLAQWKREKIVLAAAQTSCSIPAGIFSQTNGAMLSGIAYGEETNIGSRNTSGNASWNARIRVKSATMQPFDEFNVPQLVASPNAPSTLIRTFNPGFPGSGAGSGVPGTEETLNRLLIDVPTPKPPKCDPCKKPGAF
jgi:hypothetical protein